jgi:hypothetical protein
MLALHDFLHGQRSRNVQRDAGIVAFAVAGRAFDHRLMPGDGRLLRCLRNVVDIGAERDDRLALAPGSHPSRGDAGHAALDLETFLFEDSREVFGGFELLEAQLAKAEDTIDHDLRLLFHGIDLASEVGLHGGLAFRRDFGLTEQTGGRQQQRGEAFEHNRRSFHARRRGSV